MLLRELTVVLGPKDTGRYLQVAVLVARSVGSYVFDFGLCACRIGQGRHRSGGDRQEGEN